MSPEMQVPIATNASFVTLCDTFTRDHVIVHSHVSQLAVREAVVGLGDDAVSNVGDTWGCDRNRVDRSVVADNRTNP